MADSFNGSLSVMIGATLTGALDVGTGTHVINETYKTSFINGTGIDQANQMWSDQRVLTASSSEELDLAGSLTNAFGTTLTFTSIKGIVVKAISTNTNDVVIGGAVSNAFLLFGDATDTIAVKPNGSFCIVNPAADGYTVTAGTGDLLKITNSGGGTSITYDITIIGEV